MDDSILQNMIIFIIIGFFAQIIDGALGMAYGVSATTFLLTFGVPPALASASVHAAECFTTFLSGVSHLKFGNVKRELVYRLLIPGVLGAAIGAYILAELPGDIIKPYISAYLLLMGLFILYKAVRKVVPREITTHLIPLGLAGGFMDAVGGGGWGPIVVSTLVARGNNPRLTIGSANLVEFFVALTASITFFIKLLSELDQLWRPIAGLAIGGAIAAPMAAYVCRKIQPRTLMFMVGVLITLLSLRTIAKSYGVPIP